MVVAAFALAMLIQAFVVKPYEVPTGSMLPTIQLGDLVLCDRITFHFREPRVGDIVVLDNPTQGDPPLVKRVVAVGGQTLDIRNGWVYLDGELQPETYVEDSRRDAYSLPFPVTIPVGEVWVMGDNRADSADSRYFGTRKVSTVFGRAFFVYWPIPRFGSLH